MILIQDIDNPLTDSNAPNQAEVHMKPGDILTVIAPGGDETVTVLSDGTVMDPFGRTVLPTKAIAYTLTVTIGNLPEESQGDLRAASRAAETALAEWDFEPGSVTITEDSP